MASHWLSCWSSKGRSSLIRVCCCCHGTAGQATPFARGAAGHMLHSTAATLPQQQQQQQHVQQPQAPAAAPRAAQAADDDGSEVSSLQQLLLSQQWFSGVVPAKQLLRAEGVVAIEAVVTTCWVAVIDNVCVELGGGGNARAAAVWGAALYLSAPFSAVACRSACMPCQCNPILPRAWRMSGGMEPSPPRFNPHSVWGAIEVDVMSTRRMAPHGSRHQHAQDRHQHR